MRIHYITMAVAVALSACVSTTSEQSAASAAESTLQSHKLTTNAVLKSQKSTVLTSSINTTDAAEITLEKVMSDPDWMGRSPENWYWGDDSNTVFFEQKQVGTPLRDLFQVSLQGVIEPQQVPLAQLHHMADRGAHKNTAGTKEVYAFKGNIFLKDISSGQVTQLTHTSAQEYDAKFLTNGHIAYRVGNKFFEHNLVNSQVRELASLLLQDAPKAENKSYIAQEQHELINFVALQARNKELKDERNEKLKAQNDAITESEFYVGKDKQVVHAELSPAGDKLLVSISTNKQSRDNSDIMPNYISDNGKIEAKSVRFRVANNHVYNEELILLDLESGQQFPLFYDALPGYYDDVLATVKAENHKAKGQSYKTKKGPRNLHVLNDWTPIKWNADGTQVALMLEAWDNKDRWLVTVDLLENKLVSQHRLHDEAWINWAFNEFGWLNKTDQLYYLSEESGYSHLYLKSLKGKARALTSGKFEVSDLTLTADESKFVFRANKKHPGIYEIYQVEIANKIVSALTDLGGMNDYQLSPDESKLLIEHSTTTMPPELYVQSLSNGNDAKQITRTVSEAFLNYPWAAPSVVEIPSSHQDEPIYARLYLPKDYDQTKVKNRAVMFSHGAGYLQNAHLGWSGYFREFMFHSMLVQQGYVVIDMDYRASKGYGRDWRTAIYRHMGKPEVEDMRDGVNWLVQNANVDRQRIGTYGGSYGGFLTLMSMFTAPDLFQSGAALRLVSDWAYYNHVYTANILNTPEDDAIAYERSSPIYFAEGLENPLLINAPMVDDNVFFQDTVRLVQRLIELEKENFETAIYPVEPHGFVQPSSWLDEYRRIYKLFESTL